MESQNKEMSTQDYYNASVIFSQALSLILEEGQGIIVNINPEMGVVLEDSSDKVIVFKMNGAVHVQKYEGDLEVGTPVTINDASENQE